MADKKVEELRKKLENLSQASPEVEEAEPVVEEAPPIAPAPPTPTEDDPMQQLSKLASNLTPEQIEAFRKMIVGDAPQETNPVPVPEPAPVQPSEEEIAQRVAQMEAEINRLQNNGIYRAELIFQLLGINTNLERIAKSFESE